MAFRQCSPEIVWKEDFVMEVKIFEWEGGSSSSVHLHLFGRPNVAVPLQTVGAVLST